MGCLISINDKVVHVSQKGHGYPKQNTQHGCYSETLIFTLTFLIENLKYNEDKNQVYQAFPRPSYQPMTMNSWGPSIGLALSRN